MKVTLTVEVDRERWVEEYGCERVMDVIRRDVASYVETTLLSSPAGDAGALISARVR